jgi:hypothetical protein
MEYVSYFRMFPATSYDTEVTYARTFGSLQFRLEVLFTISPFHQVSDVPLLLVSCMTGTVLVALGNN